MLMKWLVTADEASHQKDKSMITGLGLKAPSLTSNLQGDERGAEG